MNLKFTGAMQASEEAEATVRLCRGAASPSDPCPTLIGTLYLGATISPSTTSNTVDLVMPPQELAPPGDDYFICVLLVDTSRRLSTQADSTMVYYTDTFVIAPFYPSPIPSHLPTLIPTPGPREAA